MLQRFFHSHENLHNFFFLTETKKKPCKIQLCLNIQTAFFFLFIVFFSGIWNADYTPTHIHKKEVNWDNEWVWNGLYKRSNIKKLIGQSSAGIIRNWDSILKSVRGDWEGEEETTRHLKSSTMFLKNKNKNIRGCLYD